MCWSGEEYSDYEEAQAVEEVDAGASTGEVSERKKDNVNKNTNIKRKQNKAGEMSKKKQEDKLKELTKMVDNKINTEDLIYEVEKNPTIWDSRLEVYSDKTEKLNAWGKIMFAFMPDFEEKPVTEKNVLVTLVQKKWKNIRSCYARELQMQKERKSGSGSSTRKKYTYFDQLRFLETISKKTTSSLEEETVNEVEDAQLENDFDSCGPTVVLERGKQGSSRKRGAKHEEDELISTLKKKIAIDIEEKRAGTDEDKLFLLSLLSEIKQVPPQRKLKLRADIISVIAAAQQGTSQPWPAAAPLPYQNVVGLHPFAPQPYHHHPHHHMQMSPSVPSSGSVQDFNHSQWHTMQPPQQNQQAPYLASSGESAVSPPIVSPAASDSYSQMSDFVTYE